MKSFFIPTGSTMLLALVLTPELSNLVGIVVAAMCVGAVNWYMAHTARLVQMVALARAIDPMKQKIDELAPTVAKIEAHVNSEKTRAEGESAAQKIQIALQREMITELKAAAALLAQARATSDISNAIVAAAGIVQAPVPTPAIVPVPPSVAPVLKLIEMNTSETARNTAKTDDNVQALKDQI